jgi:hypothetical protein
MAENLENRPNWRTGAPDGNRNALKTGYHTREAKALRARIRDLKRRARQAIAQVEMELAKRRKPEIGDAQL